MMFLQLTLIYNSRSMEKESLLLSNIICDPFWENVPKRADKNFSDFLIKA